MMVETARDFRQAGVSSPILVGGAALSNRFTRLRIAPEYEGLVVYAKDAMKGLALANTIQDADERQKLMASVEAETEELVKAGQVEGDSESKQAVETVAPAQVRHDFDVPNPPDLRLHVLHHYDLEKIFPYINPQMLYVRHLGFRGRFTDALEAGDPAALELRESVRKVEDEMLACPSITANAVFKFFPCQSDGQRLLIFSSDGKKVLEEFYFGRQSQRDGLCLADYSLPKGSGRMDYLAIFVTTIGPGVRALSEQWKDEGEFLNSHILQALALEGAEAFAELLHQRLRQMWGFGDPSGISYQDLFRTQYRGRRYSFGYPACPRLEDQEQLFRLLNVTANIGVELTDGYMMDPEGSVSALVLHHPDAKYFNLSEQDIDRLEKEIEGLKSPV
jgi:5-methyltetrahydrofolate--homocysteine methyltransferase